MSLEKLKNSLKKILPQNNPVNVADERLIDLYSEISHNPDLSDEQRAGYLIQAAKRKTYNELIKFGGLRGIVTPTEVARQGLRYLDKELGNTTTAQERAMLGAQKIRWRNALSAYSEGRIEKVSTQQSGQDEQ